MAEKNKHSIIKLRLDWSELDSFQHINNVSFFKYIQSARVNFWEVFGINKTHRESNIGPMLASAKCDFITPLFFPGEIEIITTIKFIKNSSFGFVHEIFNEKKEIVAIAEDVMVLYDFNNNKSVALGADLRQAMESYL